MLGFKILIHSIRMVFRNVKEALQIALVPASLAVLSYFLLAYLVLGSGVASQLLNGATIHYGADNPLPPGFALFFFPAMVIGIGVGLWILVSWHRFILLEEYPRGVLPPFRFDRILAYLGRALLLGVFAIGLMAPGMFIVSSAIQASVTFGIAVWVVLVAGLWVGFYRFSPVLPGAAIGKPVTFHDAWYATAGSNGQILLLVLLSLVIQFLVQFLAGMLMVIPVIGLIIVVFVVMLVLPLINVSILTTMYGVFIEKRQLT
ncbi:MAG: hypothetical protein GJ676_22025 [Rhodobacteraceae bacterium]|nr:hypothetical protein [Paracoccaceae bacterium]